MAVNLKMKLAKLVSFIRDGYGRGRQNKYRPWLPIRRNFSSPVSRQYFANFGLRPTNHHLLSALEYKTGIVNSWLSPLELREGFPAWPFDQAHPNSGLITDISLRLGNVEGLLSIARNAGIPHGNYVGSNMPYIATISSSRPTGY